MMNAIGISGMYGAAEEALMAATERAIALLGIGTVIGLALAILVVGAEALGRRWGRPRKGHRSKRRPLAPRKGRRAAYR